MDSIRGLIQLQGGGSNRSRGAEPPSPLAPLTLTTAEWGNGTVGSNDGGLRFWRRGRQWSCRRFV